MAQGFPCPNPVCTNVFTAASVKGQAAVTCPVCGKVFRFRPTSRPSAAATPTVPTPSMDQRARPVAPIIGTPSPTSPSTEPEMPSPLISPTVLTGSARKPRRGKRGIGRTIVFTSVVLGAIGLLGAGLYLARDEILGSFESASAQQAKNFNYVFRLPAGPWSEDKDAEYQLRAQLAMHRSGPSSAFAILARDTEKEKDKPNQPSELQDWVIKLMGKYFQGLEWQNKQEAELAARPARRFEFQGDVDGVTVSGECVMLTYQGFAYWFLTWAPVAERDEAAEEWEQVRLGFGLLNRREGWAEKQRKQVAVTETHGAYKLRITEGIWETQSLAGFDPDADIALLGKDPSARQDARMSATAQFLLLPANDDLTSALADLKTRFLKQQREGGYPATTVEPAVDEKGKTEREGPVGELTGRLLSLRVKNGESRERFAVLVVATLPDKVLAAVCECDWQRRAFWEPEFLSLLKTVQRKTSE